MGHNSKKMLFFVTVNNRSFRIVLFSSSQLNPDLSQTSVVSHFIYQFFIFIFYEHLHWKPKLPR